MCRHWPDGEAARPPLLSPFPHKYEHRQSRLDFAATFQVVYHFRLLYSGPFMYPIVGALRYSHGGRWEVRGGAGLLP